MIEILFALGPVFLLILLGHTIKRKNWITADFWSPAELMTYYIFFPALLLHTTAKTDVANLQIAPMALALIAATILAGAIALKSKPVLELNGPDFTSLFQGAVRPNSYVAIAGAFAMWGDAGLTLVAIAIAFIVPLVNFLSVVVMETYGGTDYRRDDGPTWRTLMQAIFRNPLILACLLGVGINQLGVSLPPVIEPLVNILGRAALPLGLLCVGAGLELAAIHSAGKTMIAASANKLLLLPLACLVCCMALGVEGITRDVSVFYASLPVSASSYVLARKMGGNASIMAGVITLTTLGAMVTIPLILQGLMWF